MKFRLPRGLEEKFDRLDESIRKITNKITRQSIGEQIYALEINLRHSEGVPLKSRAYGRECGNNQIVRRAPSYVR